MKKKAGTTKATALPAAPAPKALIKKQKSAPPKQPAKDDATAVHGDGSEYPAPPCKFKCNRSSMVLTIRVTLHHIGSDQINLETSKKSIKLDTLPARRKFKMCRVYPRGIECDDKLATARLERGALVVELPITKFPKFGEASAAPTSTEKATTKKQRAADIAAPRTDAKKRKKAAAPPSESDESDDDDDEEMVDVAPARALPAKRKGKLGGGSSREASDERLAELVDAAGAAAAHKQDAEAERMRARRAAEAELQEATKAKKAERDSQKRKLLETFRKQQQQEKAQQKAQQKAGSGAGKVTPLPKAPSTKKKKRVSFSPGI